MSGTATAMSPVCPAYLKGPLCSLPDVILNGEVRSSEGESLWALKLRSIVGDLCGQQAWPERHSKRALSGKPLTCTTCRQLLQPSAFSKTQRTKPSPKCAACLRSARDLISNTE